MEADRIRSRARSNRSLSPTHTHTQTPVVNVTGGSSSREAQGEETRASDSCDLRSRTKSWARRPAGSSRVPSVSVALLLYPTRRHRRRTAEEGHYHLAPLSLSLLYYLRGYLLLSLCVSEYILPAPFSPPSRFSLSLRLFLSFLHLFAAAAACFRGLTCRNSSCRFKPSTCSRELVFGIS